MAESFTLDDMIQPMRIFISYGHDEYGELALRLKEDLKARGHEVWFDVDHLKPGNDWEIYIEKGLDWVSETPNAGRVIILMTPHSVRRPDGYCLNEIARALSRRLIVVPIMVIWCEPPLSICRIQWLDMQDCMPIETRQEQYETKFNLLVDALERDRLDFAGGRSRLLSVLEPLPFDAEISQHLSRFTGRRWIFDDINAWLTTSNVPRVFWIVGNPGVGKTAISSWLCYHRREVAAFHFCRYGHTQKSDPRRCVLSIAYQLSSQLPEYQTRLISLNLEQIIPESNTRTLFETLIVQPLSRNFQKPTQPIVVLIDALDEATRDGRNELAMFISSEFPKSPEWFAVDHYQPAEEVEQPLQELTPYILKVSDHRNQEDLRAYLIKELKPYSRDADVSTHLLTGISRNCL